MCKFFKLLLLIKYRYLEAIIWISALILLAISPVQGDHYSLCVFHSLGFGFCPGCGLGHSITYFFNADINASINAHPFGIFAIGILIYRIFLIFKENKYCHSNKVINYG